jgi:hypothetical protein
MALQEAVNRKRVARILEDNLLAVQPKRFVTTTDSKHSLEVYLNLARRMHLTAKDQLWIADITYIRLQARVRLPGAGLGRILAQGGGLEAGPHVSRLATDALESAIAARKPLPGLVHHSDRGIQYASGEYVAILRKHEMVPSMSRPANPYEQRQLRELHQDAKARRDLRQRVRGPGTLARSCRGIHRAYSKMFPANRGESFYRDDRGRDSSAVPSPDPYGHLVALSLPLPNQARAGFDCPCMGNQCLGISLKRAGELAQAAASRGTEAAQGLLLNFVRPGSE